MAKGKGPETAHEDEALGAEAGDPANFGALAAAARAEDRCVVEREREERGEGGGGGKGEGCSVLADFF